MKAYQGPGGFLHQSTRSIACDGRRCTLDASTSMLDLRRRNLSTSAENHGRIAVASGVPRLPVPHIVRTRDSS
jgi:hypothetical protein